MDAGKPQPHSHLFTLRVWDEVLDGDQGEWRGKLQSVRTGEVRYLRDWSVLLTLVLDMLRSEQQETPQETQRPTNNR